MSTGYNTIGRNQGERFSACSLAKDHGNRRNWQQNEFCKAARNLAT